MTQEDLVFVRNILAYLATCELSRMDLTVLAYLANGFFKQSEIATDLKLRLGSISQTVYRLEARGFIEERPHVDHRLHALKITEKGMNALRELVDHGHQPANNPTWSPE